MSITVKDILCFLEEKAPLTLAEKWDNCGLLAGDAHQEVRHILVTLDITPDAVREAAEQQADLVVSHHPVIFEPLKCLSAGTAPWLLTRYGISAVCMHTNLDRAAGGVNDTLAALLQLQNIGVADDGLCRVGRLPAPMSPAAFAAHVAQKLHTAVRLSKGNRPVQTVCLCSGAGGDYILPLLGRPDSFADAYLTGELHHHEWLEAAASGAASGATVIEAGHYATEVPVVDTLAVWLEQAFPALSCQTYYGKPPYATIYE